MSQIDLTDHFVVCQIFCRTGFQDTTLEKQVGTVGDREGFVDVVVGYDDSDVFVFQCGDDALDILDGDRVDSGEGLYGSCPLFP